MVGKPILYTTMGYSGAGKSYFSKRLALEINAVRLNSDSIRRMMFESPDDALNKQGYKIVFGGLDYAAGEILKTGYSVIYDAKCNKASERKKNTDLAHSLGAESVTIWLQMPQEAAVKRGLARKERIDQRHLSKDQAERLKSEILEPPTDNEMVIIIDGQLDFQKQLESFNEQQIQLGIA